MSTVSDGLFQYGGVPVAVNYTGTAYFVHSGTGSSGYTGKKKDRPLATIDQAINKCTASKGDVIYVMEGHAETITAAAGIDADVIGISIIGLGQGRLRPTISFTTAAGADVDIDAAQVTIENIVFNFTGVASLTAPIDVNAADFTMRNCELIMSDATNQAVRGIVGATAADRMKLINNTIWSTTAGSTSAINLVGTADGVQILGNTIVGDWSTAAIENATGAGNVHTNLLIDGNYIRNDNVGDWAIELVAASTGAIQNNTFATDAIATAVDWGSCAAFNNLYFDVSDTDKNATAIPAAETTGGVDLQTISDNLGAVDTTAATGAVTATDSVMAYVKQLVTQTGIEADTDPISAVLSGTGGITTWKSAASPATGVSMSEVMREMYDLQDKCVTNTTAVLANGTTLFTIAGGPIEILSLVARCVTTNDATASTLQWSADPTDGVAATFSGASASLASVAAGGMVVLLGTALTTAPTVAATGVALSMSGATPTNGIVVGAGIITSTVAIGSTTGTWQHHLRYRPLARGVTVS